MSDFVRGVNHTPQASVTRSANTTAYVAGQCFGSSAFVFQRATKEDGPTGGAILQEVVCADLANQGTKPDLELWLFDTNPTAPVDNAAFAPSNNDLKALVTIVPIPAASFKVANAGGGAAGNCACDVQNLGIPFNTAKGDMSLYGVLVVRNAYTPVASETIQIRLKVLD